MKSITVKVYHIEVDVQDTVKNHLASIAGKITDLEAVIKLGKAEFESLKCQVLKKHRNWQKLAEYNKELVALKAIHQDLLKEISQQAPSETINGQANGSN
jgi:hypothetical protein